MPRWESGGSGEVRRLLVERWKIERVGTAKIQVRQLSLIMWCGVYAIITLCRDKRYHPLKHYRIGKGVSVVLACNSTTALRRSLDSIANFPKSVTVPLHVELDGAIRVAGEWNENAATNLAASYARAKWLLLHSCGCGIPKIPERLTDGKIACEAENGSTYALCSLTKVVRAKDFFDVHGMDEKASAPSDSSLRRQLAYFGTS